MKWHTYRSEETKAQITQSFSQLGALESIRMAQAGLNQAGPWPENLTAWLKEASPAVLQAIRSVTKGIDHACLNQDATGLARALTEYKRVWLESLTLWRNRK